MLTDNKDDYLDEDPIIPSQQWVLLSVLAPNSVNGGADLDWSVRGIKIRGVFESEAAAESRKDYLHKIDPYQHIFGAPVGRWCSWDDDEENIEKVMYANEKLNTLMKMQKEQSEKIRDHDNERQVIARQNANKQRKMMEKREKKNQKVMEKTNKNTEEIVANELVATNIDQMQGLSTQEMIEKINALKNPDPLKSTYKVKTKVIENDITNIINDGSDVIVESKAVDQSVIDAEARANKVSEQIGDQTSTVNKIDQELEKARAKLELLKAKK
jgi:hypothetical protein